MSLVVVIVLLIGYGIYFGINAMIPPSPPIDDWDKFQQEFNACSTQAEKRKYLRNRGRHR